MTLTQEFPTPAASDLQLRMSDLISALSLALDLTEGQPMGHAVKSCVLGMRMTEILKLSVETRSDLYYGLLLKDAGCSSNAARMYEIFGGDERAAKKEVKTTDWSRSRYYRNLRATQLPLAARSITMADIYDALGQAPLSRRAARGESARDYFQGSSARARRVLLRSAQGHRPIGRIARSKRIDSPKRVCSLTEVVCPN